MSLLVNRRRHMDIGYEKPQDAKDVEMSQAQTDGSDSNMQKVIDLSDFGVLPEPNDNCAIIRKQLESGMRIRLFDGTEHILTTTVLPGHRIAVLPIPTGGRLLSWGLPFGVAIKSIQPGEYICNEGVISTLSVRHIPGLPSEANFKDLLEDYAFDEASFEAAEQVPLLPAEQRRTFMGYDRAGSQGGVGTRNYIVVVPTSAYSGPFARKLASVWTARTSQLEDCHGVVACAHTEAALDAGSPTPSNWDMLLRTLAGFVSHPNVGAVMVVGHDGELLTPTVLKDYMSSINLPLPRLSSFQVLTGGLEEDLAACGERLRAWLPEVNSCKRSPQPLAHLRVALQCGGSDSFSGVSGNPASGHAAKILIEHGGAAVLAETDELMGAEPYVLKRVKDAATVKKFLAFGDRFKERLSWHGQSAETNPSGGNKLRGLYNIALKSLGAAKKKHADVCLDGVLEYSERLPDMQRGYYFLDSPGNDLESIAGQVACGCNMIFFITGNGSITNFPFAPTIKVITTSERHKLLEQDMDFNAGRFQDDLVPMADLGMSLFEDMVAAASGRTTLGERAGHSQVSIWREWAQCCAPADESELSIGDRSGAPLELAFAALSVDEPSSKKPRGDQGNILDSEAVRGEVGIVQGATFQGWVNEGQRPATERLGLVFPTSLCSGEVARSIAEELTADVQFQAAGFERFVSLPHTEGCGMGYSSDGHLLYTRVALGHITHPNVCRAVLLEHGCEKTHNKVLEEDIRQAGLDAQSYGYASAQLDGGNEKVRPKVRKWFVAAAAQQVRSAPSTLPLSALPLAILGEASGVVSELAASLVRGFVGAGGTVLVPSNAPMVRSAAFLDELCGDNRAASPSLAYAQTAKAAGVHVMDVPAGVINRVQVLVGLVSSGAAAALVVTPASGRAPPVVGHPFIPVVHVAVEDEAAKSRRTACASADWVLEAHPGEAKAARDRRWLREVVQLLAKVASKEVTPKASAMVDFQIARGPTGISA